MFANTNTVHTAAAVLSKTGACRDRDTALTPQYRRACMNKPFCLCVAVPLAGAKTARQFFTDCGLANHGFSVDLRDICSPCAPVQTEDYSRVSINTLPGRS